ncbi:hypothetical protein Tco_0636750 [Tanacetum coccineum]
MEKASQEAKLIELSKPELIKVVEEVASEARVYPKALRNTKGNPSLSSSRKRKQIELEPEVHIAGLECNRSLSEGVQFVNNKVNETPDHEIFFIDVFGDEAF